MSDQAANVKVNILGNDYTIKGQANEDYIQELAHYVNEKMWEIAETTNLSNQLKISILAAVNLADEIFRLRAGLKETKRGGDQSSEAASIAPEAIAGLIAHIDAALKE